MTILSVNLLLASVLLGVVGWSAGIKEVIGVAASMGVIASSILAASLGYNEPSVEFLIEYYKTARNALMKLAEDMNLTNHTLYAVPRDDEVIIVMTNPASLPENPKPLVGIDGGPYIAFTTKVHTGTVGGVEDALRTELVEKYMVSRSVRTEQQGEMYRIVFEDLNPVAKAIAGKPLSPITIATLAVLSRATGSKVLLSSESFEEGVLELRVMKV